MGICCCCLQRLLKLNYYSKEEVLMHSNWITLNGIVYDITDLLKNRSVHPAFLAELMLDNHTFPYETYNPEYFEMLLKYKVGYVYPITQLVLH